MRKTPLKYAAAALSMFLLLVGLSCFKFTSAAAQALNNPLFPPEMNAARLGKTEFVIGDLGGVPVKIPHYFANYVEYDGDPSFGEKRAGAVPARTYQSKLASFGFKVRFPDMAGRSSSELWKDFEKYSDYNWKDYYDPIKSISPWIDVGVNAGSHYPVDGFLVRRAKADLTFRATRVAHQNYEKLPKKEYDLFVYAPAGIDPQTKKSYRARDSAEDVFVDRNKANKVNAYITCTNNRQVKWTTCTHWISMEPNMRAALYVSYSRKFLPQWRQIQKNVSQLVWSFQAHEVDVTRPPVTEQQK
jgi:hypothetical protein